MCLGTGDKRMTTTYSSRQGEQRLVEESGMGLAYTVWPRNRRRLQGAQKREENFRKKQHQNR